MKHMVPDERIERTLFGDIHFSAQFFFQIYQQSSGELRQCARAGVNHQIEVAFLAGITPRKGTEHTHARTPCLAATARMAARLCPTLRESSLPIVAPTG